MFEGTIGVLNTPTLLPPQIFVTIIMAYTFIIHDVILHNNMHVCIIMRISCPQSRRWQFKSIDLEEQYSGGWDYPQVCSLALVSEYHLASHAFHTFWIPNLALLKLIIQ